MSEIKVRKGTKISADEAKKLDRTKMGVALGGRPEASDVEGQMEYIGYTECPWCGNIGRSIIDSNVYTWFTCGMCGRPFKA